MEAMRADWDGPTDRWLALVSAVEQLSAAEDLQAIIRIVRDTARRVSGADGITFVLRDGDQCHYVDEDAVGPLWKGRRFPLTTCVSGWCMLRGETAVIPDIYVDPRVPHDAYRPTFVKSLIMAPVRPADALGAIGFYWAAPRAFSAGDLALAEGLARSTTVAVEAAQSRARIRQSEARLHLALEAGRLGAWELDLASLRLKASPQCRAILGWPPGDDDLTQSDLLKAIHPDDLGRSQMQFNMARAGRGAFQVEVRAAEGDRWLELRGAAIHDAEARVVRMAGVVADVTEGKLARARIDRLQSELSHAGRLSELGRMSAAIAHELNQPLAAAANYLAAADRLARHPDPSAEDVRRLGEKAGAQVDRAGQILRRIRGFAARGDATRQPEDMRLLIVEALELACLDLRHRDVDIELLPGPQAPRVVVDRTQVLQVALNLIRNALESVEGQPTRRVAVSVTSDTEDVTVRVADNGPGLAPEVRQRLFEPFTTTKADGMGVGLSISRGIVEAHGGRIWIEDPSETGAIFAFSLPLDTGAD
ncbi:MAG: ATP-binding protein [Phenylobacterium sp.]|nr:ATP-binding protein [Phenylobacterium sp.]